MTITQVQNEVGNPDYTLSTSLDGRTFILRFRFNSRMPRQVGHDDNGVGVYEDGSWLVDVLDKDNNPILSGRRIVSGTPTLWRTKAQSTDVGRPPGDLFPLDTTAPVDNPGFDAGLSDLAERVLLMYADLDEVNIG